MQEHDVASVCAMHIIHGRARAAVNAEHVILEQSLVINDRRRFGHDAVHTYDAMRTIPHDYATPMLDRVYDAWPLERRDFTNRRTGNSYSYQPDLTGSWRGSGSEAVETQRNRLVI